jgi:7-keto-8-aminopelargonate synthetase-like enzyme
MVEYPGVGRGNAMFRFQVMASHSENMINEACRIMATSRKEVEELIG